MINKVSITTPLTERLELELRSPEKSGFFVKNIAGLGSTKSDINIGESLYEDGGYFNSARKVSRNMVLDLGFVETDYESIEDIRNKSYRFFPMKALLSFMIETDTRIGIIDGYVETNDANIFSREEGTVISVICPSAYFHGKDIIVTNYGNSVPWFEFPFSNESLVSPLISFGEQQSGPYLTIPYTGDSPTGVVVVVDFTGPVNIPIITDETTGEYIFVDSGWVLQITGSDFIAGDKLIISTVKGNRYMIVVRSGVTWNILTALSETSSWFQLIKGSNVFSYTSNTNPTNMVVSFQHQILYDGV